MDNSQVIQDIELNIKQAQLLVDTGNALERLRNNQDFKKIISQGYFEQEAIRLVHLKSDQNMQTPALQASIVAQMDAIGALNQYFQTVFHRAALAEKAIAADEETRDELLAEDLNNG
jgi:hypothetical protein